MTLLVCLSLLAVTQPQQEVPEAFWLTTGIERIESPEIGIVPGPRLAVLGDDLRVRVGLGETVDICPSRPLGGEGPWEAVLTVGGSIEARKSWPLKGTAPRLSFASNTATTSWVRYVALGSGGRQVTLSKFEMLSVNDPIRGPKANLFSDIVRPESHASPCFVFYGQQPLGKSLDGRFTVDARRLAPGYYEFFTVPIKEGVYGSPTLSKIWVPARVKVEAPEEVSLIERTTGAKVSAQWIGIGAVKQIRLYSGNYLVASQEGDRLNQEIPLTSFPTSKQRFTIVAEYADGMTSAPETFEISIKNPVSDAERARDARRKKIDQLMKEAEGLDAEVMRWYEKALAEPQTLTITSVTMLTSSEWGRSASVALCNSYERAGLKGEYMARCREAILKRAGAKCEIGSLLVDLGRNQEARVWLEDAIREAGEGSAVATKASSILQRIRASQSQ